MVVVEGEVVGVEVRVRAVSVVVAKAVARES